MTEEELAKAMRELILTGRTYVDGHEVRAVPTQVPRPTQVDDRVRFIRETAATYPEVPTPTQVDEQ